MRAWGLRPLVVGLVVGLAVGLAAVRADAQAAAPSEPTAAGSAPSWAYDLAGELMSPFCPGRTLASCPSPQAGELIQWIATQEAAGASREEVVAMLVERHGEEILGRPPAEGITLWAYVFPVLGFVGFGLVAVVALRRLVGGAGKVASAMAPAAGRVGEERVATAPAPVSSASREDLARAVDAELAERA